MASAGGGGGQEGRRWKEVIDGASSTQPSEARATHHTRTRSSTRLTPPRSLATPTARSSSSSPSFLQRWKSILIDNPCSSSLGQVADTNQSDVIIVDDAQEATSPNSLIDQGECSTSSASGNSDESQKSKDANNGATVPSTSRSKLLKPPAPSPPPTPRCKNRASLSKRVRSEILESTLKEIRWMPTPSLVRDQVLIVHGEQPHHRHRQHGLTRSLSVNSDSSDNGDMHHSQSSLDKWQQPLSSTISTPFYSSPTRREVNTVYKDFARSKSNPTDAPIEQHIATIEEEDEFATPKLRRVKSLISIPLSSSKQSVPATKSSPTSVLDFNAMFWGGTTEDTAATTSADAMQSNCEDDREPSSMMDGLCSYAYSSKEEKGVEVTPTNRADSAMTTASGGFFSELVDLDWCCYDTTANNAAGNNSSLIKSDVSLASSGGGTPRRKRSKKGCGGYIDYSGVYHPCTNVITMKQHGDDSKDVGTWNGHCQGCVFREGTHDTIASSKKTEELYYDSDPGQYFAVGTWHSTSYPVRRVETIQHDGMQQNENESSPSALQRSKMTWRRRRKHRSRHSDPGHMDDVQDFTTDEAVLQREGRQRQKHEDIQHDKQAYLYDYFSKNDHSNTLALRTGFCSTVEKDVAGCVQVSSL